MLFLIEMDFWRAGVIQGFILNFNLYLLTFVMMYEYP